MDIEAIFKHLDLNAALDKRLAERPPLTSTEPERGIGKRIFIAIPVNQSKGEYIDYVEIYTEGTVGPRPEDDDLGYTENDVQISGGINIYRMMDSDDMTKMKRMFGCGYDISTFLKTYISNPSVRVLLERIYEDMERLADFGDSGIEQVNMAWSNKIPGRDGLYEMTVC